MRALLEELETLRRRAMAPAASPRDASVGAVRRMLASRGGRIAETEALFAELCEQNRKSHEAGQQYIRELEAHVEEFQRYGRPFLVRAASRLSKALRRLSGRGES